MTKRKKLIVIFSVLIALTLLIILNSVLFSVQHVSAVCSNDSDIELDALIEANHGIRKGSSIFTLNEEKTAETVKSNLADNGVADVEVIGIERRFPNRVVIHYIKTVAYFFVRSGGQAYYFSNRGAALSSIKPESDPVGNTIELKIKGELLSKELGAAFSSTDSGDRARLDALLGAFERTEGLPFSRLREYFGFADIAGDYIYIKTKTGVYLEFKSIENFAWQFENGLSAYMSFVANDIAKASGGTIIVDENNPTCIHTPDDRYGSYGGE